MKIHEILVSYSLYAQLFTKVNTQIFYTRNSYSYSHH